MDNFFRYFRREAAGGLRHQEGGHRKDGGLASGGDRRPDGGHGSGEQRGKGGSFGWNATMVRSPQAALSVAAWHRGVELRAKTMSQLVIEYQKRNAAGGNFVKDTYGASRRLNYLLGVRPNPLMTASVLMQQCEVQKIMTGNAFVYVERDEYGEVEALWLCTSGSYNPLTDTYALTFNGRRGACSLLAPSADVLHIPNTFRDSGGYMGIPTLRYAVQVLSIAATNDRQALDNSAKGGKLKLLVQEERSGTFGLGRAAKDQLEKITQKLNDDIYEQDVVLLNNVANVTPISQNAQQMELLASRGFSVAEVARMLGVPKTLLMDDSNATYKSPEASTQEFLLRTIQPMIREWEDELNSKLLTVEDYGKCRFHVCEQALRRLDPKGQAEIDKINLETGVKSVNELRAQYDLPAIDAGETHYVSTNLAEVGSEKLRGKTTDGTDGRKN